MTTLVSSPPTGRTLADLLGQLGVSADRVRLHPPPGTATERDLLDVVEREKWPCELVYGVLVEKAVGLRESLLACFLIGALRAFIGPRNLGVVSGEGGTMRLVPGLVRIPDVAFTSWDRFPGRRIPDEPIPDLTPDLAVEVLSESNTRAEMARKRREYFAAGTRLVWQIDPRARTADVYADADHFTRLTADQALDGGDVLPGFTLPLADLFAELDRTGGPA